MGMDSTFAAKNEDRKPRPLGIKKAIFIQSALK
jgi:hypothetical protein